MKGQSGIQFFPVTQSNDRLSEMTQIWETCQYLQPSYLIYTTFVLEGYSIAEKLRIPSLPISLFPLDLYPMPNQFEQQIQFEYPELYKKSIKPNWKYIQHWMWRLFLDDQGDFRESVLDLDPVPVIHEPPTLVYALDPFMFPEYPKDISQAVGFWPLPYIEDNGTLNLALSEPVLLIHFGSMDTLSMKLITPDEFVQQAKLRIEETLSEFKDLHIVWMVDTSTLLYQQLRKQSYHERIHIIAPEEHGCFTKKFNVIGVIHHGGVNTCCSMIHYTLHQAILPFMFDQPYWASRLKELGISRILDLELPWIDTITWMLNKSSQQRIEFAKKQLVYNSVIGQQHVIDALLFPALN